MYGRTIEHWTAFEALVWEFGNPHFKENIEQYLFVTRLVDWERAATIELPDLPRSMEATWRIMRQVGFVKNRVIELVDPALQPLVDRVLDLPILTLESCSGHPEGKFVFYSKKRRFIGLLTLVFREPQFGKNFVRVLQDSFRGQREFKLYSANTPTIATVDVFGVKLPLSICLNKCLPLHASFDCKSLSELQVCWEKFSVCLDKFDGRGLYCPTEEQMKLHASADYSETSDLFRDEFAQVLKKASSIPWWD